jgi:hypothetical protein
MNGWTEGWMEKDRTFHGAEERYPFQLKATLGSGVVFVYA